MIAGAEKGGGVAMWVCSGCGCQAIAGDLVSCPMCGKERDMPKISAMGGPTVYDPDAPEHTTDVVGEPAAEPTDPPAEAAVVPPQRDVDPDDDVDVDGDGQISGYETYTKVELVARIDELNKDRDDDDQLPTTGNKPDLVKRIQDAEAETKE